MNQLKSNPYWYSLMLNKSLKIFSAILSFLLIFTLSGCFSPELAQRPDGSWYETGETVLYPDYKVVRGKKAIKFPEKLQIEVAAYREKWGIWPYTLESFVSASKNNKTIVSSLYKNGYRDVLLISRSDTLFIYFRFAKQYILKYDQFDEDEISMNIIPGVWKYFPTENGKFGFEEGLYVDY